MTNKTFPRPIVYAVIFLLVALLACSLPTVADNNSAGPAELIVSQTRLSILESFPVQVQLSISGQLPDACTEITDIQSQRSGNLFQVSIVTHSAEGNCPSEAVPFERQIPLDVYGLPAGEYQVEVEGVSQSFTLSVDNIPATEAEHSQPLTAVGQGVQLLLADAAGGQAVAVVEPGQGGPDAPMPFMNYPDRIKVNFPAYPLSDTFHSARIELYPLEQTINMNQAAADTIAELRSLLQNPPAQWPEPLPFLPIFNAGPMIQAQEQLISTDSVEGVRYLTQYGQAVYPVNNDGLFYTFQGITIDQAYYVLAILPVHHGDLPATGDDYLGQDPQEFFDGAQSYFAEMKIFLDEQAAGAFTPDLLSLDQIVGSLRVE